MRDSLEVAKPRLVSVAKSQNRLTLHAQKLFAENN